MKIDNRLKTIASFVDDNSYIIDVGCDHALLDIYLCKNKKNIKAIASDINELPLKSAEENIIKQNLQNQITTILADGLKGINELVDTVIISGLGGTVIKEVLTNKDALTNIKKIIICPNNKEEQIREYLTNNNYIISNEILIEENKIIYPIIEFVKGHKKISKKDLKYGPILQKNKNNLFKKYYQKKLKKQELILNKIPNKYFIKKLKLKKEIRELKYIL